MKILLDENIPHKLKLDFGIVHEVMTISDVGWNGKKNGELLGLMTLNGFDFFITLDKNLRHQQNLGKFDINIIVLMAWDNKHQTLQPLIEKVKQLLNEGLYNKLNIVEM